jgi:hypothetical protein
MGTMHDLATSFVPGDPGTILDRHAIRRKAGVPTVSVLVGLTVIGRRAWRRRMTAVGRSVVVASGTSFPSAEWIYSAARELDIPAIAVRRLAQRVSRDPDDLLLEWQAKTPADRDRFWEALAPTADDHLLRTITRLAVGQGPSSAVAASLGELGDPAVPILVRLAPAAKWPSILLVCERARDMSSIGPVAAGWAARVPPVPIAVAVSRQEWDEFVATVPESRAKAILREGEVGIPIFDTATIERMLSTAGAVEDTIDAIAASGADAALVESAVAAVRATTAHPSTQAEDDRARSAAEAFLFQFLDSLPETAGRFELNAALDFRFGPGPAEVDLLCRCPRIAIELDGYFHFLAPDGYRRDRTKDWELQRRGFVVLRFLAEDVIPQLESIRDRILDALTNPPQGENP